jgi:SAM-dependent methyltransferase
MVVTCGLCQKPLPAFHVFPKKALFTKPVESPAPDAVADMGLAYCRSCRHISSHLETHIFPDELKRKLYGELYKGHMPTGLSPLQQRYRDFLVEWIGGFLAPRSRVFEIGCHDGYVLSRLAAQGHRCEGVEPSPFADLARERYRLPVAKGFFHADQFDHEAYDLVIMRHVVEHVDDPAGFVAEATRLVKPDGLLYLEVPDSYASIEQAYFPEFHADHISYFTIASLLRVLDMCGVREIVHQETALAYMKFPFLNVLARKGRGGSRDGAPSERWFLEFRIESLLDRFVNAYAQYVRNLRTVRQRRNLAVWGAGSIGIQYAIDAEWTAGEATYVDVNSANQGLVLSVTGHRVHAPEIIRQRQLDTILIASGWEEDVRTQVQPYLVPNARVLGFSDLLAGVT